MQPEIEIRHHELVDYEIRTEGKQRIICGIAAPFDSPTKVFTRNGAYTETIAQGAFTRTLQQRSNKVKVYLEHDYKSVLGTAHSLKEEPKGLYAELRISRTAKGDEILELVEDGALDAFSVGFVPVKGRDIWSQDRTAVTRSEVQLLEVSLTSMPAYQDALITAVRNSDVESRVNHWKEHFSKLGIQL